MNHIGLFEGFGGFSLAARWTGWETVATCEIADFPRRVIEYHFPNAYSHKDIHDFNYESVKNRISERFGDDWRRKQLIITGGFPCQPYSVAGKRLGKEDDRHLWPQMFRVIREFSPDWVVGENVYGIVNWNRGMVFEEVQADLEAEGYEVWPVILPAAGVGAPHKRERIWFIAHRADTRAENLRQKWQNPIYGFEATSDSCSDGQQSGRYSENRQAKIDSEVKEQERKWFREDIRRTGKQRDSSNAHNKRFPNKFWGELRSFPEETGKEPRCEPCGTHSKNEFWENFPTQPPICGGNDGFPKGMVLDSISFPRWRNESIKGYGNAIVPQVAYEIFKIINMYNNEQTLHGNHIHAR